MNAESKETQLIAAVERSIASLSVVSGIPARVIRERLRDALREYRATT